MLDRPAASWARPEFGRGCSSGVEHDLAKVGVEGSNPFARSKKFNYLASFECVLAIPSKRIASNQCKFDCSAFSGDLNGYPATRTKNRIPHLQGAHRGADIAGGDLSLRTAEVANVLGEIREDWVI